MKRKAKGKYTSTQIFVNKETVSRLVFPACQKLKANKYPGYKLFTGELRVSKDSKFTISLW